MSEVWVKALAHVILFDPAILYTSILIVLKEETKKWNV